MQLSRRSRDPIDVSAEGIFDIEFTNGWNSLFLRGLNVTRLPGDNISILSDLRIAKLLAQQINMLVDGSGSDRSNDTVHGAKSVGDAGVDGIVAAH